MKAKFSLPYSFDHDEKKHNNKTDPKQKGCGTVRTGAEEEEMTKRISMTATATALRTRIARLCSEALSVSFVRDAQNGKRKGTTITTTYKLK